MHQTPASLFNLLQYPAEVPCIPGIVNLPSRFPGPGKQHGQLSFRVSAVRLYGPAGVPDNFDETVRQELGVAKEAVEWVN